jgi:hypothetical protein
VVGDGRFDLSEQALRPQRLALMREGDHHAAALSHHRGELVLRLGEAARGDGWTLRLEHMRLRPGQRVESGCALEARRLYPLLLPETRDVVDLPDEIGRRLQKRNAIGFVVAALEIAAGDAFPRGVDRRVGDRMERALRER